MICFDRYNDTLICKSCAQEKMCIRHSSTIEMIKIKSIKLDGVFIPSNRRIINGIEIDCTKVGCTSCGFSQKCEYYEKGERYFAFSRQSVPVIDEEKAGKVINDKEEQKIRKPNMANRLLKQMDEVEIKLEQFYKILLEQDELEVGQEARMNEVTEHMNLVEAKLEEFYRFIWEKDQEELKKQQAEVVYEEPARGKKRATGAIDDLAIRNEILWDDFIDRFNSKDKKEQPCADPLAVKYERLCDDIRMYDRVDFVIMHRDFYDNIKDLFNHDDLLIKILWVPIIISNANYGDFENYELLAIV